MKPANDEDYEDEDEDDEGFGGGAKKGKEVEEDPLEGNSTIFVKIILSLLTIHRCLLR